MGSSSRVAVRKRAQVVFFVFVLFFFSVLFFMLLFVVVLVVFESTSWDVIVVQI